MVSRQKSKEYAARYRQTHRDEILERARIWYQDNPNKALDKRLRSRYKISLGEVLRLADNVGCLCPICGKNIVVGASVQTKDRLVVDHNHETGDVRGVLCWNCNVGLGFFEDKPESLARAIIYLRERGGKSL